MGWKIKGNFSESRQWENKYKNTQKPRLGLEGPAPVHRALGREAMQAGEGGRAVAGSSGDSQTQGHEARGRAQHGQ